MLQATTLAGFQNSVQSTRLRFARDSSLITNWKKLGPFLFFFALKERFSRIGGCFDLYFLNYSFKNTRYEFVNVVIKTIHIDVCNISRNDLEMKVLGGIKNNDMVRFEVGGEIFNGFCITQKYLKISWTHCRIDTGSKLKIHPRRPLADTFQLSTNRVYSLQSVIDVGLILLALQFELRKNPSGCPEWGETFVGQTIEMSYKKNEEVTYIYWRINFQGNNHPLKLWTFFLHFFSEALFLSFSHSKK